MRAPAQWRRTRQHGPYPEREPGTALYDADLPGGTLRFAEFFRFSGGLIASIKLLYDPQRYTAFGGR
jgi:hypothetical protein